MLLRSLRACCICGGLNNCNEGFGYKLLTATNYFSYVGMVPGTFQASRTRVVVQPSLVSVRGEFARRILMFPLT